MDVSRNPRWNFYLQGGNLCPSSAYLICLASHHHPQFKVNCVPNTNQIPRGKFRGKFCIMHIRRTPHLLAPTPPGTWLPPGDWSERWRGRRTPCRGRERRRWRAEPSLLTWRQLAQTRLPPPSRRRWRSTCANGVRVDSEF